MEGKGTLPIVLVPGDAAQPVHWQERSVFGLSIESRPNPGFWAWVESKFGVRLEQPHLKVDLAGTMRSPQGSVDLEVPVLEWRGNLTNQVHPRATSLRMRLLVTPESARLESLDFRVEQQPVHLPAGGHCR